jgi:hypothetical protein
MSKYYEDLVDTAPVARELKYRGKTKTVYFRRLDAGQRLKLVAGQKMAFGADGQRGSMEMDMGEISRNRHQLVQFTNVSEVGAPIFNTLDEVQALPDSLVSALAQLADEVNKDEDAAPKG